MKLKDFKFNFNFSTPQLAFGVPSLGSFAGATVYGMCGSGYSCSGGGGQCGSGYNCGGGGGMCGSGYNCGGGGGQCGSGYNCSGT